MPIFVPVESFAGVVRLGSDGGAEAGEEEAVELALALLRAALAVFSVTRAGEFVGDKLDADRAVCEVLVSRSVEDSDLVILDVIVGGGEEGKPVGSCPGKYDMLPGLARSRRATFGIVEGALKAIIALSLGHQHGFLLLMGNSSLLPVSPN